jgi:hypothetical protein
LAAQGHVDVDLGYGRAPISLFLLTVAASGERKSACDNYAMSAVIDFQKELAEQNREEATRFINKLAVWEEARKAILAKCKRTGKGPDAYGQLEQLGPQPDAPLSPAIVAGDPTFEGLTRNLVLSRPSLGVFSDEGGTFIGGHAMNQDNKLKTAAGFSTFWDGKPINRWRAGDGASLYFGRRLSAHLMVQPIAAVGLLADPIANGQGLLARFLVVEPVSTIGSRLRTATRPGSLVALQQFNSQIAALLRLPLPLVVGTRNELQTRLLEMAPDARRLLQEFAIATEIAQAPGQPLQDARPFASKAGEHAARLAAVLTIFRNPNALSIDGETMCNAIRLANFYIGEARRLADAALISRDTADAERMRVWLLERWGEPHISAADAAQRGPFKETKKARQALLTLQQFGWLIPVEHGAPILSKHRREAWLIRTTRAQ